MVIVALCLSAFGPAYAEEAVDKQAHERTLKTTGKWQNPVIVTDTAAAAKLKAHPVLKVDLSVPAETSDTWFQAKLAVHADGMQRAESPKWLLDRAPGAAGINKVTLTWDTTDVVAKMPGNPTWFKIELVTQGDHARTVYVDNVRYEDAAGATVTEKSKPAAVAATPGVATEPKLEVHNPTPYPPANDTASWPGKGPIRTGDWMAGERKAFWPRREADQGKIVFVGDSIIGGWKKLQEDFPGQPVANRGVGGDVSRGILFRLQQDVLDLHPKAIVLEIGGNDNSAGGTLPDYLFNVNAIIDLAQKANPDLPVILCGITPKGIPASTNPGLVAWMKKVYPEIPAWNAALAKIASTRKNVHFVDFYTPLLLPDGSGIDTKLFNSDQVHPTDAAHTKLAGVISKTLAELK